MSETQHYDGKSGVPHFFWQLADLPHASKRPERGMWNYLARRGRCLDIANPGPARRAASLLSPSCSPFPHSFRAAWAFIVGVHNKFSERVCIRPL